MLALDVQPDGALHVAFGLAGKGALTLPAVLTHAGLTLPIADLANTQGRFVPADALPHSHGPGLAGCF